MGSRTGKRKLKADPVAKLARSILPEAQVRSDLVIRDVANHSIAEQRDSMSLGQTKTVRRLTRVELLHRAGIIDHDQLRACEYYLDAYELGYQTIGCTANYMGAGGGGFGSSDLLARYKAQAEARENYLYARQAIPKHMRLGFDRIVLGPLDIRLLTNRERTEFSLAAFLLHGQIGHMLAIAA